MTSTLQVGDLDYQHEIGNKDCECGWCGSNGYPLPCTTDGCTGLVHADFGDETEDGYWLYTKCDVCGEEG
jgi:hypothetical protein